MGPLLREFLHHEAPLPVVPPPSAPARTPQGLISIWKSVIYAKTEPDSDAAWLYLLKTFPLQVPAIDYLTTTYMPWRRHFMECFVTSNRNFGVRATSRTEGSHKEIKSYLFNTSADLSFILQRIEAMLRNQEEEYKQEEARQVTQQLREHKSYTWLGDIRTRVSWKAQKLIVQQFRIYNARITKAVNEARRRPAWAQTEPLDPSPCTGAFRIQFGLPCSHDILERLSENKPLNALDVDPHWHLSFDLADPDYDGYIGIQDPLVVPRRGRPVVGTERIPAALIPPRRQSNIIPQSAAERARDPSHWEEGVRGPGGAGAAGRRGAHIRPSYVEEAREMAELGMFDDDDDGLGEVEGGVDEGDSCFIERDFRLQQLKDDIRCDDVIYCAP